MVDTSTNHSLSGSWRGHYTYASGGTSGFEAVFLENKGKVEGNILDDGRLDEAAITGSFANPRLKFTKSYYNNALNPVEYQGVMSDDGNTLTGTWRILNSMRISVTSGTWIAKRYTDAKELDIGKLGSQDLTEERQKELVQTLMTNQR